MITTINEFRKIHENTSTKVLYRTTVFPWLSKFLTDGVAVPSKGKEFISFSKHENSGNMDEFGDIRIDFDAAQLYAEGAVEIEYTTEFFGQNPEICKYVTGYTGESEYYDANGFAGADDANAAHELSWEQHCENFSNEEEVVLKKLSMKPGLIRKVTVWDADERDDIPEIRRTMQAHGVAVDVPWETNESLNKHQIAIELKRRAKLRAEEREQAIDAVEIPEAEIVTILRGIKSKDYPVLTNMDKMKKLQRMHLIKAPTAVQKASSFGFPFYLTKKGEELIAKSAG